MTDSEKPAWNYVRPSKKSRRTLGIGSALFVFGGFAYYHDRDAIWPLNVLIAVVSIVTGALFFSRFFRPWLKCNEDRVVDQGMPFWARTYLWSDLTNISYKEAGNSPELVFAQRRSLPLSQRSIHKCSWLTGSTTQEIYRQADSLKLTNFAERKLKENARTS